MADQKGQLFTPSVAENRIFTTLTMTPCLSAMPILPNLDHALQADFYAAGLLQLNWYHRRLLRLGGKLQIESEEGDTSPNSQLR